MGDEAKKKFHSLLIGINGDKVRFAAFRIMASVGAETATPVMPHSLA